MTATLTRDQILAEQARLVEAARQILTDHPDALPVDVRDALGATGYTDPWGHLPKSFHIHEAMQKVRPFPTLTTAAEASVFMARLAGRFDDVGVFHDRGWGDSGQEAEISVIVDGDGQAPLAWLTDGAYRELCDTGVIGPNILNTFKARRFHAYIPGGR